MTSAGKTYKLITVTILLTALLLVAPFVVHVRATTADAPAGSTFEQRLNQRKAEQAAPLDEKTIKRLQSICTNVQQKIRDIQSDARDVEDKRTGTYKQIDSKLWIAIGKLKLADKDTFKLEQSKTKFNKEVAAFLASLDAYQQTLDDLLVVNCQADPVGFNALILTARHYYSQLTSEAKTIQNTVVNTIKPTLGEYSAGFKKG